MQSILGRDGIATALYLDGDIQAQKGVTPFSNHPRNCCPGFLPQINIKTHTDIADQQTTGCSNPQLLVFAFNQPIIDKCLQQFQIVSKIIGKLNRVSRPDLLRVK